MSLRHALLGFLSVHPFTGYDLKKMFDQSVQHFWPADQAQIYRMLAQLVDEGFVEVRVVPQDGRPDRKEHSITTSGAAELDRWLQAPLEPQPIREPFLLKVFFAGRLARDEIVAIIDERIADVEQTLDAFGDIVDGVSAAYGDAPLTLELWLPLATLENGLRHLHADLDWLRELRNQAQDPAATVPDAWLRLKTGWRLPRA